MLLISVSISLDNLVELQALNPILYPGVPTDQGILAHAGFMLSQTFTAPRMLYAVQAGVKQFGTNNGQRPDRPRSFPSRPCLALTQEIHPQRLYLSLRSGRDWSLARWLSRHSERAVPQAADAVAQRQEPSVRPSEGRQPSLCRLLPHHRQCNLRVDMIQTMSLADFSDAFCRFPMRGGSTLETTSSLRSLPPTSATNTAQERCDHPLVMNSYADGPLTTFRLPSAGVHQHVWVGQLLPGQRECQLR